MKNKEFLKLLKKRNYKSNSGFTLTELLVGLFMSIFVIGALGFGLVTVLQTTQRENSKTAARNENSRALDFISDEVRRARAIEADLTNARVTTTAGITTAFNVESTNINPATGGFNSSTTTNKKIVFAIDIPEVSSSATLGADADASTTERIIYFLKSAGTNWRGPSVLYRWGPPLDANGNYTAGEWSEQALIDGIDNTHIADSPCATGTPTPPILTGTAPTLSGSALSTAATGFHACITGTNTAQLFLTGQTEIATGVNDTQTNDSQVVARARTALAERTDENDAINWDVESLGGSYSCNPNRPGTTWDMATDFTSIDPDNPSNNKTTSWVQKTDQNRQAQPIQIDPDKNLEISSTPQGAINCLNTANTITHPIDFDDPTTFNGDHENGTKNVPLVGRGDVVQFFKKGSTVPNYGGYNADGGSYDPSQGDQLSLGQFLYSKGLAIPVSGGNPNDTGTTFELPQDDIDLANYLATTSLTDAEKAKFKVLGNDQRIIAFEMGNHADTSQPGFDLQDNIFVVTSNAFKKKFSDSDFPDP